MCNFRRGRWQSIVSRAVPTLASMPALARLLLARSKLTRAGVSALLAIPSLRELDIRGVRVLGKTLERAPGEAGSHSVRGPTLAEITELHILPAEYQKISEHPSADTG